jgi:hypothetical protein
MYYSETNPLKRVKYKKREDVPVPKGDRQRRLHKALLRYHDPENWKIIREALISMGKQHLIGDKVNCLVPAEDFDAQTPAQRRKSGRHGSQRFATKHSKSQPGLGGEKPRNHSKSGGKKPTGNGSQGNANQGNGKQNAGGSNNGNGRKPATGFIKKGPGSQQSQGNGSGNGKPNRNKGGNGQGGKPASNGKNRQRAAQR